MKFPLDDHHDLTSTLIKLKVKAGEANKALEDYESFCSYLEESIKVLERLLTNTFNEEHLSSLRLKIKYCPYTRVRQEAKVYAIGIYKEHYFWASYGVYRNLRLNYDPEDIEASSRNYIPKGFKNDYPDKVALLKEGSERFFYYLDCAIECGKAKKVV